MGLGQERDFYGDPNQSNADDNITKGEGRLAEIVNQLNKDADVVSKEDFALLVAALCIRTKKMREAMSDLVKSMSSSISAAFQEQRLVRDQVDAFWNDKRRINQMIDLEVRKQPGLNREMRFKAKAFARQQWNAKRQETYEQLQRNAVDLAAVFFEKLDQESAAVGEQAFRRVFEDDPSVPKRVETLESFRFSITVATHGEFILGDCAGVGVRSDGQVRLAVTDFDESNPIDYIFLPISQTHCVVASRKGNSTIQKICGKWGHFRISH